MLGITTFVLLSARSRKVMRSGFFCVGTDATPVGGQWVGRT